MENNKNLEILEGEKTPSEYFDYVKNKKNTATEESLSALYDKYLELLNKYVITGQTDAIKKIIFHMECIESEKKLIDMGINTFIYYEDIEYYIDQVSNNVVKIIELERYEREIPDEIVPIIEKVKPIFTNLYVVFTDYSREHEAKTIKEKEKDPILFGAFSDKNNRVIDDRFYFLGDWVDEYCDLTLDKMVKESIKKNSGSNITHTIKTPEDISEIKEQLAKLSEKGIRDSINTQNLKYNNGFKFSNIFKKIRTIGKKK